MIDTNLFSKQKKKIPNASYGRHWYFTMSIIFTTWLQSVFSFLRNSTPKYTHVFLVQIRDILRVHNSMVSRKINKCVTMTRKKFWSMQIEFVYECPWRIINMSCMIFKHELQFKTVFKYVYIFPFITFCVARIGKYPNTLWFRFMRSAVRHESIFGNVRRVLKKQNWK